MKITEDSRRILISMVRELLSLFQIPLPQDLELNYDT